MFYDFQIEYVRKYAILRDYYIKTDQYEGIMFILSDKQTGEIVKKLVLEEDIVSEGEWRKTKSSKQTDYIKIFITKGQENMMVEEVGKVKRKGMFDKEIKVDVKQYRYFLEK